MTDITLVDPGVGYFWKVEADTDADLRLVLYKHVEPAAYNDWSDGEYVVGEYVTQASLYKTSATLVAKRNKLDIVGVYEFEDGKLVKR